MQDCVVITGFEPFGEFRVNPSGDFVRRLDGKTIGGLTVTGRVLPVTLTGLQHRVDTILDELQPQMLIAFGLAGDAQAIRIERLAVNRLHFDIPDNDGAKPQDAPILADGPDTLPATLALPPIEAALRDAGIPVEMSDNAGTYLCNATFYHFLDAIRRRDSAIPCGFIHVPGLPGQAAAGSMELAQMERAARIAIEVQARFLRGR